MDVSYELDISKRERTEHAGLWWFVAVYRRNGGERVLVGREWARWRLGAVRAGKALARADVKGRALGQYDERIVWKP